MTDASSAITLRREMIEAIHYKLHGLNATDDLQWPLVAPNGTRLLPQDIVRTRMQNMFQDLCDEDADGHDSRLTEYWERVLRRYDDRFAVPPQISSNSNRALPRNWIVINISVTEDKGSMFISRQCADRAPIIVCLPMTSRRDNHDDEHLTLDGALHELQQIIQLNDEGTRGASQVDKDDKAQRAAWWGARNALDNRLRALLENVEFCWLGVFKVSTIYAHFLDGS